MIDSPARRPDNKVSVERIADFPERIDVRSPSEYAEDHLPGATNYPVLDDVERARIGTMHAEDSAFAARRAGAALVARNIAAMIETSFTGKQRDWAPLVYCWRGGQRSGSLSLVLGQIGFTVHVVEGGYKAFRAAVIAELPALAQRLPYRVVCGPTGSGKTRLLQALEAAGAQVLDLEGLASHRSSVLGLIPGQPQPTQKRFDTLVWEKLRGFDPGRPVYVESESKKVGNVAVPEALIAAMRGSPCLRLDLSDDERVQLLLEDYAFFSREPDFFCQRLDALVQLRGREQVQTWQAQVRSGQIEPVVRELLLKHYDPGYASSTRRNFQGFEEARAIAPRDRSPEAMAELARELAAE